MKPLRTKKRRSYRSSGGKCIKVRCLPTPVEKRYFCGDAQLLESTYGIIYAYEALHLLQGEGSVVTRLAPPTGMLLSPQGQATPIKTECDRGTKTGNTCNALSGKPEHHPEHLLHPALTLRLFHTLLFFQQVPSQGFPTSSVSGERAGGVGSTRRSPAAAWPPLRSSARLSTA